MHDLNLCPGRPEKAGKTGAGVPVSLAGRASKGEASETTPAPVLDSSDNQAST